MELVYLWVEDYKNIKKQGFNFSPRFTCVYDEDNNELTTNENEDYIENFFGDNINVTAIVGKNGSGKSSLLELIDNHYRNDFLNSKNFLFVYKINESYYCIYSLPSQPTDNKNIIYVSQNEYHLQSSKDTNIHLATSWIALNKMVGKNGIKYMALDGTHRSALNIEMKDDYFLGDNQFFIPNYIEVYRKNQDVIKKLEKIYSFDTLRIRLRQRTAKSLNWLDENNIRKEIINLVDGGVRKFLNGYYQSYDLGHPIKEIGFTQQLGINLLIGFVEFYLKKSNGGYFDITLRDKLNNLAKDVKDKKRIVCFEDILSFIKEMEVELGEKFFNRSEERTFKDIIESAEYVNSFESHMIKFDKEFYINIELKDLEADGVLNKIIRLYKIFEDDDLMVKDEDSLRILELDLVNSKTDATYQTLSDGEKQFLRFSMDFFNKLSYVSMTTQNKSFIILADEIDNSLHPLWKKEVISRIIDLFKAYRADAEEIYLHFVFTTHSPFLLSDIPKQNIIFLDTYKKDDIEVKNGNQETGNCKVVDGLKEKKQTFGANIHTLLSDSFFMDNGLMGEFAKDKINEIIDFFNGKNEVYGKDKERLKKIIETIGEAFLKDKLLRMYDEKYPKTKEEEIAELKAKIERLENG